MDREDLENQLETLVEGLAFVAYTGVVPNRARKYSRVRQALNFAAGIQLTNESDLPRDVRYAVAQTFKSLADDTSVPRPANEKEKLRVMNGLLQQSDLTHEAAIRALPKQYAASLARAGLGA